MRTVTRTAYKYDELPDDAAKEKARQAIYEMLSHAGSVTDILRETAADWLTNEGWTGLAELRDGDGPDLDKMQFSISHSQSDFVAWASTRPVGGWTDGEVMVTTRMRHYGGGFMHMDVYVTDDSGEEIANPVIERRAKDMVYGHRSKVLSLMHTTDLDLSDNEDFLAEYADNAEMEFWADGSVATW